MRPIALTLAASLLATPALADGFHDLAAIDNAVAAFTGAAIGAKKLGKGGDLSAAMGVVLGLGFGAAIGAGAGLAATAIFAPIVFENIDIDSINLDGEGK